MDDKSDPTITFDKNGVCNYCRQATQTLEKEYFPNEIGQDKLNKLLSQIKRDCINQRYDCMMGISGGLDSSYLAYLGYTWNLRILGVHIDDGFDTEVSQNNIRKLCEKANIDLITIKPNTEQYYSLIKAYLKAGVPDLAVPQDNILFANLYEIAHKERIKYFLSGSNLALESILQKGNSHNAEDVINIKNISQAFNPLPTDKLKFISRYKKEYYTRICKITTVKPLNLLNYNKDKALTELSEFCDFEYYGGKHLENIFTAFMQLYWLPQKFNVDKRTSHLSSMIISGQITRDKAIIELGNPSYDENMMREYIEIIKDSLEISDQEFKDIMEAPIKQHTDYKTDNLLQILTVLKLKLKGLMKCYF